LRVAVANDFEIVIAGLAAMLDRHPGIVVVDMFIVGEETPHEPIDIVLYDAFGREGIDGPQLSTLVSTQNVHHVAVFTLSWADSLTQSALGYGVSGVLSKSLRSEDLAARLHEIADGTIVIAPPPNGRVSSGLVAIGRDDHLACPNARPKHWSCSLRVCVTARSPARCT
jgi:DNA-binding NarL/FixJ family response regulator